MKSTLFPMIYCAKLNPKLSNLWKNLLNHFRNSLLNKHFIFAVIVTVFILLLPNYDATVKAANVMQCMSNCIKHEGDTATAKAICKLRCANITFSPANTGSQPYCMSIFKKCTRACNKNKSICWKNCKKVLMECN